MLHLIGVPGTEAALERLQKVFCRILISPSDNQVKLRLWCFDVPDGEATAEMPLPPVMFRGTEADVRFGISLGYGDVRKLKKLHDDGVLNLKGRFTSAPLRSFIVRVTTPALAAWLCKKQDSLDRLYSGDDLSHMSYFACLHPTYIECMPQPFPLQVSSTLLEIAHARCQFQVRVAWNEGGMTREWIVHDIPRVPAHGYTRVGGIAWAKALN